MSSPLSLNCGCQIWSPEDGSQERYKYSRLERSQDIRILRLEPGYFDDPLVCSLEPLTFGRHFRKYEALSYAWGDSNKTHTLLTPSQSVLGVTSNLHGALHHLRSRRRAIYIWIDALCINQESLAERSQQVSMMGKVYSAAYKVTAWIGDEYEDSEEAFGLIREYKAAAGEDEDEGQDYIESLWDRQEEPCRMALWKLLNRPWFRRIWVIQEVVLAKDVKVVCGESYCTWDGLVGFATALVEHGLMAYIGTSGSKGLLAIDTLRSDFYQSKEGLDLGYLLGKTRHFQFTDPHDKIYGLAALLQKEDLDNIVVDYELPVAIFYHRLLVNHIQSRRNFDLLFMGGYASHKSSLSMATWCCDWSLDIGGDDVLPLSQQTHDTGNPFQCGGTTEPDTSVDDSSQVLVVAGYKFDVVAGLRTNKVLNRLSANVDLSFNVKEIDYRGLWQKVEQLKLFSQKSLPYPDNLDLSSVWPRLLVCNQGPEDQGEPSERYFQMNYRLLERGLGSCDTDSSSSYAEEAGDEIRRLASAAERYEHLDLDAVKLQAIRYGSALGAVMSLRSLCLTEGRYLGWVPLSTEEGDIIAIFKGAKVPFVLRPIRGSRDGSFTFIGECYIHGIMYGEAIKKGNLEECTFRIR